MLKQWGIIFHSINSGVTYPIHLVYRWFYHIWINYPLNKLVDFFVGNGLIFSIKSWKIEPIIIIHNFCSTTNIHMLMFIWGKNNYPSIYLSWSVGWILRTCQIWGQRNSHSMWHESNCDEEVQCFVPFYLPFKEQ